MFDEFDEQEVQLIEAIQNEFKEFCNKHIKKNPLLCIFTVQIFIGELMEKAGIDKENAFHIIETAMEVSYGKE